MADKLAQKISHGRDLIALAESKEGIPSLLMQEEIEMMREWIGFFQHERLIHLMVLILVAILTFASFGLYLITHFWLIIVVFALFSALLVPYIFHYYSLENGVQQLYDIYERLKKKQGKGEIE
jgi:hypothetical protein